MSASPGRPPRKRTWSGTGGTDRRVGEPANKPTAPCSAQSSVADVLVAAKKFAEPDAQL